MFPTVPARAYPTGDLPVRQATPLLQQGDDRGRRCLLDFSPASCSQSASIRLLHSATCRSSMVSAGIAKAIGVSLIHDASAPAPRSAPL